MPLSNYPIHTLMKIISFCSEINQNLISRRIYCSYIIYIFKWIRL